MNELLAENYSEGRILIKQDDIIQRVLDKLPNLSRNEIFSKKYLDFEKRYEDAGWKVVYDRPAFDENYQPFFAFTEK